MLLGTCAARVGRSYGFGNTQFKVDQSLFLRNWRGRLGTTASVLCESALRSVTESRPSVVSLFSGAGGLDKGLELAGFKTLFASDLHEENCETLKKNFPAAAVLARSITELSGREILRKLNRKTGDIDLVAGGPPCQAFSILGNRKSLEDPRGALVFEFARIIKELKPRAFVFENVKGLTSVNGGRDWKELIRYFQEQTRYELHSAILNAADFGVPQFRERVFIVGLREPNRNFEFPSATHAPVDRAILLGLERHKTVRDAFRDMHGQPNHDKRIHGERVASRYARISPGGRDRTDHTDRLEWDKPSGTVLVGSSAGGGRPHIHPKEHRHITVREGARLQSFPDDFVFMSTNTWQYRQVGNAVPPLLAKAIGEKIRDHLESVPPQTRPRN